MLAGSVRCAALASDSISRTQLLSHGHSAGTCEYASKPETLNLNHEYFADNHEYILCWALASHEARHADELSFHKGDELEVFLEQQDSDSDTVTPSLEHQDADSMSAHTGHHRHAKHAALHGDEHAPVDGLLRRHDGRLPRRARTHTQHKRSSIHQNLWSDCKR